MSLCSGSKKINLRIKIFVLENFKSKKKEKTDGDGNHIVMMQKIEKKFKPIKMNEIYKEKLHIQKET